MRQRSPHVVPIALRRTGSREKRAVSNIFSVSHRPLSIDHHRRRVARSEKTDARNAPPRIARDAAPSPIVPRAVRVTLRARARFRATTRPSSPPLSRSPLPAPRPSRSPSRVLPRPPVHHVSIPSPASRRSASSEVRLLGATSRARSRGGDGGRPPPRQPHRARVALGVRRPPRRRDRGRREGASPARDRARRGRSTRIPLRIRPHPRAREPRPPRVAPRRRAVARVRRERHPRGRPREHGVGPGPPRVPAPVRARRRRGRRDARGDPRGVPPGTQGQVRGGLLRPGEPRALDAAAPKPAVRRGAPERQPGEVRAHRPTVRGPGRARRADVAQRHGSEQRSKTSEPLGPDRSRPELVRGGVRARPEPPRVQPRGGALRRGVPVARVRRRRSAGGRA